MLEDLTIDKCQNGTSGYRTWTKNNLQGTKRLRASITQWKLWVVICNINCSKNEMDY